MKIEGAIIGVGLLILARIPRGLAVPESAVDDNYDAALQEFTDDIKVTLGIEKFEPPMDFRQRTVDHVKWYLETKRHLA
jgi:hypothetical protein